MSANGDRSTENISVSMPGWLIEELDRARKKNFRSRSDFVCEAVRKHILSSKDTPDFWDSLCKEDKKESY